MNEPAARTFGLEKVAAEVAQLWEDYSAWAGDTPPPDSPEYIGRKRAFTFGAKMMRRTAMLTVLDGIARRRPLDPPEAALMAGLADRMARHKRPLWRWTVEEDARIMALIRKRARTGRPAPYKRNRDVARLAQKLGRSYMAVHRRMERLRAANCSNAGGPAKG
jgi:hypothetical protein